MTTGVEVQPGFKNSGLGWAGQIPASWGVAKICLIARLESGHTPSRQHPEYWVPDECTVPWFSLADVWQIRDGEQEHLGDTAEKVSPRGLANSSARLLPAGTVVLSRTASVGFSGIMPIPMATTQDFADWICGPRLAPEYLLYCFRGMTAEFERFKRGSTHQTIYMPDIRGLAIPVPERREQERIISFLRQRLPILDSLIIKKERLAALLQEQRQARISAVVTQGLDLNVPMKDSGIYWLGKVPAHWKLEPNGRLFREVDERGLRDLPVLSVSLSTGVEERDFNADRIQPKMSDFADYKVARRDDVVFNKMRMWQGAVGVAPIDGFVSPDYTVLRPGPGSNPWFFSTLYRTVGYTCEVNRFSHGIALDRNRIYWDAFRSIISPVPPRPEQDAIVAEVERLKEDFGKRLGVLEKGTALLREYRQALIFAAVTGKIDIPAEEAA